MPLNPLIHKDFEKIYHASRSARHTGGEYLDLRGINLSPYKDFNGNCLKRLSKIVRGLIFTTVETAQSGHPGGSSSKVEQFLALTLGGSMAFDPADPKHPGRDRMIWSAGHCTPLLYSGQALLYEALRRTGRQFSEAVLDCVLPEELLSFRRGKGLAGHAESIYPFSDYCTGPSGHGFSAAVGIAMSHRASGLPTRIWVMMGDAESEEGLTYEARNVAVAGGINNLIVSLDYNHFGIDGPIEEAMSAPYLNYWLGFGWNVIEADGHNINELFYAYSLAAKGFGNGRPTAVIAHTVKGKEYGKWENTAASHGSPADHDEYVKLLRALDFQISGEVGKTALDMEKILDYLNEDDCKFIEQRFIESAKNIEPEAVLVDRMKKNLVKRKFIDPRLVTRPKKLPAELVFKSGEKAGMRHAAEAWFKWLMKQTAFFYAGAGDLSGSVGTKPAENVFGIISDKNPFGRGIRFGIAEQNMAMMSMALTQDILPGGYRPVSVFGTYAVFSAMYGHAAHLALINNSANPAASGFFIALATHDGPETGEDGPTHQGMYWMSLFSAYPGIKIFKPADANETIEMLFYALKIGEPVVLALPRVETFALERGDGFSKAEAACDGAYVYKNYSDNNKIKLSLAVCGGMLLENVIAIVPELEKNNFNVKLVIITSPGLFSELARDNPEKAAAVLSDEDRRNLICLHNGWRGFLRQFISSPQADVCLIGVDKYLGSGKAQEVYMEAGLDQKSILSQIILAAKK